LKVARWVKSEGQEASVSIEQIVVRELDGDRVLFRSESQNDGISAAFSSDGTVLGISGKRGVQLVDTERWQPRGEIKAEGVDINAISFRPGVPVLAGAVGKEVWLWDTTGGLRGKLEAAWGSIGPLTFSPDGRYMATGGFPEVRLWDTATARLVPTAKANTESVTDLAFSPTANYVAAASNDGTIKLWNTRDGHLLWALPSVGEWTTAVVFRPAAGC
jgi:WD40 repeat protein